MAQETEQLTLTIEAPQEPGGRAALMRNDMMKHLVSSLERGEEIGHYGHLVFAMVARHFLDEEEICTLLCRDPKVSREEAEVLLTQVRAKNYNPPRPQKIAEWQREQEFPICPDLGDPDGCNVYKDLQFPAEIYEQIAEYYQQKT